MVLWVVAANRAARDIDRPALAAIRAHFAAEPNRRRPPMLLVLTHVDTLRPFDEWQPPYDLAADPRGKARSIRGAMEAAGRGAGLRATRSCPCASISRRRPTTSTRCGRKIIELMPEAQRARLLRCLSDIKSASGWGTIWSQAANAGRVIRGTFLTRRSTSP